MEELTTAKIGEAIGIDLRELSTYEENLANLTELQEQVQEIQKKLAKVEKEYPSLSEIRGFLSEKAKAKKALRGILKKRKEPETVIGEDTDYQEYSQRRAKSLEKKGLLLPERNLESRMEKVPPMSKKAVRDKEETKAHQKFFPEEY